MGVRNGRHGAWVFAAYLVLALVQTWPLPKHLSTHLTGQPTGDTGVYVWNLWVFRHELVNTHTTPLSTLEILPLDGPTDLSLHNYTVFADVLALPFLDWLGVVRTFNLIYVFNIALAGFGVFLLARRLTNRQVESFLAGLVFAWSPFLVTRGGSHFSLVAAAPIPIFVLLLYRSWDTQRLRDALLAGAVVAWAAFCDPYYAVYCVMLGALFLAKRTLAVTFVRRPVQEMRAAKNLINVGLAVTALLILVVNVIGQGDIEFQSFRVSMHTLYTPVLILTVLAAARLALASNLRLEVLPMPPRHWLLRAGVAAGAIAGLMMSPTLFAIGRRVLSGDVTSVPVPWRSSAPGVDLLAFLVPNPNHPFAPVSLVRWLESGPGGYADQVASLSLVGLAIMAAAWRYAGFRPPKFWLVVTAGFAILALGPFLQVAGLHTEIPTPWALLRYLPLVGSARMPARFVVVATMGFSVLLAMALAALTARFPAKRRLMLTMAGLALSAELIAAPRTLYSADAPAVFDVIAADPRPVRVLELPTGIRDGLSSMGDFNAQSQFLQTFHGKALIGGYLSRVPQSSKTNYRRMPVISALIDVSEGRRLTERQIDRALANADDFVRRAHLGYVVMDTARTTSDLRDFAVALLGLKKIAEADGYALYVPRSPN